MPIYILQYLYFRIIYLYEKTLIKVKYLEYINQKYLNLVNKNNHTQNTEDEERINRFILNEKQLSIILDNAETSIEYKKAIDLLDQVIQKNEYDLENVEVDEIRKILEAKNKKIKEYKNMYLKLNEIDEVNNIPNSLMKSCVILHIFTIVNILTNNFIASSKYILEGYIYLFVIINVIILIRVKLKVRKYIE